MNTLRKDQAALPQCEESAYIYALSSCKASNIRSAFPTFENMPSSWDGLFGTLFCYWWGWFSSVFAQSFIDHFGNPNSSQWLHWATHKPAAPSELPQSSAVSSACLWKKLIQCHCRHQTAKSTILHVTLFLVWGRRDKKEGFTSKQCNTEIVSCCLLHLIFNQDSTMKNHSVTNTPQAHFLAPCKSQRWAGKAAEISVHHQVNMHFKGFVIQILFTEPDSSISHNITEFSMFASLKGDFSLLSSLKQHLVCLQQSTPRENAQR